MLKESEIGRLKVKDVQYMLADVDGLYIVVSPKGRRSWLLRLTVAGKRRKFVLGTWPAMSLRDARVATAERRLKIEKLKGIGSGNVCMFSWLVSEWEKVALANCTPKYVERTKALIKARVLPKFENCLAGDISALDVLSVIRAIEAEGKYETAHRVLGIFERVFEHGMALTLLEGNPAASLSGLLVPRRVQHFARLTDPRDVGVLMRAIAGYPRPMVRNAMLFSAYTFCRPGEIRHAEWEEFDFNALTWRLPAEKMKMRKPHIVPLPRQAVDVLNAQKGLLIDRIGVVGRYVFPSSRFDGRPMSGDTVLTALRALDFSAREMSAHGFRSTASTILNESGLWSADAIERQLAHSPADGVRETYNYAQYLPERTKMMQWYADELDRLRDGKEVDNQ